MFAFQPLFPIPCRSFRLWDLALLLCIAPVLSTLIPGWQTLGQDLKVPDSEKRSTGFLSPKESLRALHLPDGFGATLFAAEPQVRQPIAATTDDRGRLWVCENYTYSESSVNFDLSLSDRIVILEDGNGDGQADRRTIFWDQGKRLTGIAIGMDGIYVTCSPHLLFIPDRDHDDRPDGPPEILLDGWNTGAVRHNIVNGLMWGPDGWLYGRHGILATSFVGVPGATPSQRTAINCGIWRYHPIHHRFEVVAHGTTNPWGMDFNNQGDLFMINTVIGHLWHVLPGARYERMYGAHFNPFTYKEIPQTADHYHWNKAGGETWNSVRKLGVTSESDRLGGGHAHCGLLIQVDTHWPDRYRGVALTCNLHGRRINMDRLVPAGNGYVGKHQPDFGHSTDPWFRGIELVRSGQGGFFLLDWQDTGECHENDGVHRNSGRIFHVIPPDPGKANSVDDFRAMDNRQLINSLSRSRFHFLQATMVLRMRAQADERALKEIAGLARDLDSPQAAMLRVTLASDSGMATVYGVRSANGLLQSASVKPNRIREIVHVLRNELVLQRDPKISTKNVLNLLPDSKPTDRLELASLLGTLAVESRLEIGQALAGFENDRLDPVQPLMIWYAVEPAVCEFPQQAAELALMSRIPVLTRLVARRLAERFEKPRFAQVLMRMLDRGPEPQRLLVLEGLHDALRGRRRVRKPDGWDQWVRSQKWNEQDLRILKDVELLFGDGQALTSLQRIAEDGSLDPRTRGLALVALAKNDPDSAFGLLNRNLKNREVRPYVIEAYAYCNNDSIGKRLIQQFGQLKPDERSLVIDTLSRRKVWARELLRAVEEKKIARSAISAWHARQIDNLGDAELSAKLNAVWGAIKASSVEKQAEAKRLIQLIRSSPSDDSSTDPGSTERGQELFAKTCGKCHVLNGQGANIGPDLTGGNRHDLGYLVENIVDPSASIAEAYRTTVVELKDGRTLTGLVVQLRPNVIELQTADRLMIIDRRDVERMKRNNRSLMPEGLLRELDPQSIRDLFRFLMAGGPPHHSQR